MHLTARGDDDSSIPQLGTPRVWDGISYRSKHGDDLENWAIFEPSTPIECTTTTVDTDDPDLLVAMNLHGLTFETHGT